MARFWQRTKDSITAPAQYIQTTDSVSRPMAVMMSLLGIFLVGALIVGLVFAGRWGYEQITGKDSKPASGQVSTGDSSQNAGGTTESSETGSGTITNRTPGTSSSTNDVQNSTSPRGTTGSSATVNGSATTPTNTGSGNTATSVPNTGPENLVALFVITSLASALAHRLYLQKRLKD
jgi:hypothetical protein